MLTETTPYSPYLYERSQFNASLNFMISNYLDSLYKVLLGFWIFDKKILFLQNLCVFFRPLGLGKMEDENIYGNVA